MFHHHHDLLDAGHQVHGAAGTLDHLAGNHPVGQVAVAGDLHAAEDRQVDLAAADHGKRFGGIEEDRAGNGGDGLLAGVDQVGIDLVFGREGADAEQAVFRLQNDVDALRDEVGHQGRHADAEVDVGAVGQLLGHPFGHPFALGLQAGNRAVAGTDGALFDGFFELLPQQHTIDVDAGQVNLVRIELAGLNHFFDLGDRDPAGFGAGFVEIARRLAEDEVARLVRLPGLDDGQIGGERLLQDVFPVAEALHRLAFGQPGAIAGAGEKSRNAGAAGAQFLRQGSLGRQLQFQFAVEKLFFKECVFADIAGNHLFDLARLQQQTEAEVVDPGVVADDRQVFHAGITQGGDKILRNAAQTETAGGDGHAVKQKALKGCLGIGGDGFHGFLLNVG